MRGWEGEGIREACHDIMISLPVVVEVDKMVVQVEPYQQSALEELNTVLRLHYSGCGVDLVNIRDFPHHGHNSDMKLVDLMITEPENSRTVSAIIKTINLKDRHRLVGCQLSKFFTREVVFYTKIFPGIINHNQSKNYFEFQSSPGSSNYNNNKTVFR